MDLAGVLVYNPDKDGVDAGDLCGEPPTGIKATTDRTAVQGLGADCVVYMPRATWNWQQYTEFMTQWARSSQGFDTVLRRVCELPGLVYLELEERHARDGGVAVVNSLSVCEFNAEGKIRHLDVYPQQPR